MVLMQPEFSTAKAYIATWNVRESNFSLSSIYGPLLKTLLKCSCMYVGVMGSLVGMSSTTTAYSLRVCTPILNVESSCVIRSPVGML